MNDLLNYIIASKTAKYEDLAREKLKTEKEILDSYRKQISLLKFQPTHKDVRTYFKMTLDDYLVLSWDQIQDLVKLYYKDHNLNYEESDFKETL